MSKSRVSSLHYNKSAKNIYRTALSVFKPLDDVHCLAHRFV